MSLWQQPPQVQGTRQPKGCWGQGCWAGSALLAHWRWPGPVLSDSCPAGLTLIIPPRQYLPLLPSHRQLNSAQRYHAVRLHTPACAPARPRGPGSGIGGTGCKACGLHEQFPPGPGSLLPCRRGQEPRGGRSHRARVQRGFCSWYAQRPLPPPPRPTVQFLKLYLSCLAFLS